MRRCFCNTNNSNFRYWTCVDRGRFFSSI